MTARRDRILLGCCLLFAAIVFLGGVGWGLPSRAGDACLFGGRPAATGLKLLALDSALPPADWADPTRGADVDTNPLNRPSDRLVLLNGDLASRAEIVRRYRLFSYQPDEMITFMAFAKMSPGNLDLDPKLYQYGGLWIYPIALLLKAGATLRLVDLQSGGGGLAYYLDQPEAFARFYLVARLYTAMWGLVGVWAVFTIVRRITRNGVAAAGAAIAVALMPVVVNMAHEAKPHLPGMVLMLLAVMAGGRYVETGRRRDAATCGALCGATLGMVLSTLPIFAILPAMALLRRKSQGGGHSCLPGDENPENPGNPVAVGQTFLSAQNENPTSSVNDLADKNVCPTPDSGQTGMSAPLAHLFLATAAAILVYAVTNPYVVYHALTGGEALRSNLGNSSAFYHVNRVDEGAVNVVRLMIEGASWPIFIVGMFATVALAIRAVRVRRDDSPAEVRRRGLGLLLAIPAVLTAIQAALVGAGKPGEFGRFLLLTDVFLAIEAFVLIGTIGRPWHGRPARVLALEQSHGRDALATATFGIPVVSLWYSHAPEHRRDARATVARRRRLALVATPILVLATAVFGWPYLRGFVRDAGGETSRLAAAEQIEAHRRAGAPRLILAAEPAPYAVPPINVFDWPVLLAPKGEPPEKYARPGDVIVTVEEGATPISWADKPMRVRVR